MATTATTDLPDDPDERRAHVHQHLGNWLQRELDQERPEFTANEAADAINLPERDVRHALNDLVDDAVTPLTRDGGTYRLER
jgi:Fic family protein